MDSKILKRGSTQKYAAGQAIGRRTRRLRWQLHTHASRDRGRCLGYFRAGDWKSVLSRLMAAGQALCHIKKRCGWTVPVHVSGMLRQNKNATGRRQCIDQGLNVTLGKVV